MKMDRDNYVALLTDSRPPENKSHKMIHHRSVDFIAQRLWNISQGDKVVYVANVLKFMTDNTKYSTDRPTQFVKYPTETLFEGGGDCEDLVVAAASLIAWADISTGIAYSENHAALAISFDERESQADYPNMKKVAELFEESGSVNATDYFDPNNIHPFSILVIPKGTSYEGAISLYNKRLDRNSYYQEKLDQRILLAETGEELTMVPRRSFLSRQEMRELSVKDGIRLEEERRREDMKKQGLLELGDILQVESGERPVRERSKELKYFYIEATANDQWIMFDRLPITLEFLPAEAGAYRNGELER